MGFFQDRVSNYLPWLASNLDPPNLCRLSSYDYRCEPLALRFKSLFELFKTLQPFSKLHFYRASYETV
jgi:hypothetical protein